MTIIPNTRFSDDPQFGEGKFNSNTYTNLRNLSPATEIITEKKFNDKPVYRRNFSGAVSASGDLITGGIEDIVSVYGNVDDATGIKYFMNNTSFGVTVNADNDLVLTLDVAVAGNPYNITVEYTKV